MQLVHCWFELVEQVSIVQFGITVQFEQTWSAVALHAALSYWPDWHELEQAWHVPALT